MTTKKYISNWYLTLLKSNLPNKWSPVEIAFDYYTLNFEQNVNIFFLFYKDFFFFSNKNLFFTLAWNESFLSKQEPLGINLKLYLWQIFTFKKKKKKKIVSLEFDRNKIKPSKLLKPTKPKRWVLDLWMFETLLSLTTSDFLPTTYRLLVRRVDILHYFYTIIKKIEVYFNLNTELVAVWFLLLLFDYLPIFFIRTIFILFKIIFFVELFVFKTSWRYLLHNSIESLTKIISMFCGENTYSLSFIHEQRPETNSFFNWRYWANSTKIENKKFITKNFSFINDLSWSTSQINEKFASTFFTKNLVSGPTIISWQSNFIANKVKIFISSGSQLHKLNIFNNFLTFKNFFVLAAQHAARASIILPSFFSLFFYYFTVFNLKLKHKNINLYFFFSKKNINFTLQCYSKPQFFASLLINQFISLDFLTNIDYYFYLNLPSAINCFTFFSNWFFSPSFILEWPLTTFFFFFLSLWFINGNLSFIFRYLEREYVLNWFWNAESWQKVFSIFYRFTTSGSTRWPLYVPMAFYQEYWHLLLEIQLGSIDTIIDKEILKYVEWVRTKKLIAYMSYKRSKNENPGNDEYTEFFSMSDEFALLAWKSAEVEALKRIRFLVLTRYIGDYKVNFSRNFLEKKLWMLVSLEWKDLWVSLTAPDSEENSGLSSYLSVSRLINRNLLEITSLDFSILVTVSWDVYWALWLQLDKIFHLISSVSTWISAGSVFTLINLFFFRWYCQFILTDSKKKKILNKRTKKPKILKLTKWYRFTKDGILDQFTRTLDFDTSVFKKLGIISFGLTFAKSFPWLFIRRGLVLTKWLTKISRNHLSNEHLFLQIRDCLLLWLKNFFTPNLNTVDDYFIKFTSFAQLGLKNSFLNIFFFVWNISSIYKVNYTSRHSINICSNELSFFFCKNYMFDSNNFELESFGDNTIYIALLQAKKFQFTFVPNIVEYNNALWHFFYLKIKNKLIIKYWILPPKQKSFVSSLNFFNSPSHTSIYLYYTKIIQNHCQSSLLNFYSEFLFESFVDFFKQITNNKFFIYSGEFCSFTTNQNFINMTNDTFSRNFFKNLNNFEENEDDNYSFETAKYCLYATIIFGKTLVLNNWVVNLFILKFVESLLNSNFIKHVLYGFDRKIVYYLIQNSLLEIFTKLLKDDYFIHMFILQIISNFMYWLLQNHSNFSTNEKVLTLFFSKTYFKEYLANLKNVFSILLIKFTSVYLAEF